MKLVECVPNFSEGRRKNVIEAVVAEARSRNVNVLDIESDADHNRSVLTFVGSPDAVRDAALAVSAKAIELIDLNKHKGQHPRMGAVDVVPFIPISEVTIEECVQLAKNFANVNALSDLQTAIFLANASTLGALSNVSINLGSIKDEDCRKQTQAKMVKLQSQIEMEKTEALKVLSTRTK